MENILDNGLKEEVFRAIERYYSEVRARSEGPFTPGRRIPIAGRVYDEKEMVAAVDAVLDFWLTAGRYAARFEGELARFLGVNCCSIVNSGSSANLLAFMALTSPMLGERRIRKGDEVITVAAAFPTTVTPVIQYGAIPVFVDVTIPSYNLDSAALAGALSERTKAVFVAHTLGNPFDVKAVRGFCDANALWLLEDNCDALGSRYFYDGEWRYTGTFGHVGTSSFFPAHHITMGEGGAVYTDDFELKKTVDSFRDWGRDCWCRPGHDNTCGRRFDLQFGELPHGYDHKYVYSHFGYNLRATEMQAAIGCSQLRKLPHFIEARRRNWSLLRTGLDDLQRFFILPEAAGDTEPSWFGFALTVADGAGFSRNDVTGYLEECGIQTRTLFAGNLVRHPCFDELRRSERGYRIAGTLKNTDVIMNRTFWLGVYPGITEEMILYIVQKIQDFIGRRT